MRTFLIWALCCAVACGAEVPATAPLYSLVRVKLVTGERATVFSAGLMPVDVVRTYDGIVFTGPAGRYAVLIIGEQDIETKFCEIKGNGPVPPVPPGPDPVPPDPPNPPTPPIDPIAARLYAVIKPINDKGTMLKLAQNYQTVMNEISSGSIVSPHVARTRLSEVNRSLVLSQSWKPAVDAMIAELKPVVEMTTLKKVLTATITALELASK